MLRLPAVLVRAIQDFDFADKPLWRIGEGLHHLKVELTYLLPTDQPTADRGGKKQPIMSKGAGKKKPAPPAGEWARQPQPAERPPTSLPALKQTAPPPTLTTTTQPPATILFKRRPMTSTPVAHPPKKMPSRPVPTTKQPVPEPMPPGANVFPICTAFKMKEPKPLTANQRRHHEIPREVPLFVTPPATVAPVRGYLLRRQLYQWKPTSFHHHRRTSLFNQFFANYGLVITTPGSLRRESSTRNTDQGKYDASYTPTVPTPTSDCWLPGDQTSTIPYRSMTSKRRPAVNRTFVGIRHYQSMPTSGTIGPGLGHFQIIRGTVSSRTSTPARLWW